MLIRGWTLTQYFIRSVKFGCTFSKNFLWWSFQSTRLNLARFPKSSSKLRCKGNIESEVENASHVRIIIQRTIRPQHAVTFKWNNRLSPWTRLTRKLRRISSRTFLETRPKLRLTHYRFWNGNLGFLLFVLRTRSILQLKQTHAQNIFRHRMLNHSIFKNLI